MTIPNCPNCKHNQGVITIYIPTLYFCKNCSQGFNDSRPAKEASRSSK